ncbi:MAG: sigma-54 dependent transcriptional regulator [Bdellovibrionota bacterium]
MSDFRKSILIVDDEESIRSSLSLLLKEDYDVHLAEDGDQALESLGKLKPDVVLMDVMMPKKDGIDTLKELREANNQVPVIMLTGANTVKTAVQAMKWGAVDYINKPFEFEHLSKLLSDTIALHEVESAEEFKSAREDLVAPEADFGSMVGRSASMKNLFEQVAQVAPCDTTVLITGESGTGKELIAKSIHDLSNRKAKPFVAINCAAIPESLIESELFGHEKGAFTHAVEKRIGYFELANEGTLFLDEIGELSLPVQVKMLRFLQEQEFYPVGRSKPVRVNVRIIAATNKNLEELIKQKLFRQDLYYRINVVNLGVPPLRNRYEDIASLASYFLKKFKPLYGGRDVTFSDEAVQRLVEYEWPGNVRELENVIESLMALSASDLINEEDLPRKCTNNVAQVHTLKTQVIEGELNFEEAEKKFEMDIILTALKKTNFVQTRAADMLGISRRILKYKMDKLGISEKPEEEVTEGVVEAAKETEIIEVDEVGLAAVEGDPGEVQDPKQDLSEVQDQDDGQIQG